MGRIEDGNTGGSIQPQRGGMFIARGGIHQIHQNPRGATGDSVKRDG